MIDSHSAALSIDQIREPVRADLQAVDQLILDQLHSDIPLIRELTQHIIRSGGKRVRPLLVVLSAKALGYKGDEHIDIATIIEFVHTATLLHDDVVDNSDQRRGKPTANTLWSNQASILVGDFLYSRAFQLLTRRDNIEVMRVLANTTNAIAEGEIMQLANCHSTDIDEAIYNQVIERKTAALFQAAAQTGALVSTKDTHQQQALTRYGYHVGMAFQIIDDVLDYTADKNTLGKNIGDDLMEGKMTLPLIYAIAQSSPDVAENLRTIIQQGDQQQLSTVIQAINNTHAADQCVKKAEQHTQQACAAIANLPDSAYRQSLFELAEFALRRVF